MTETDLAIRRVGFYTHPIVDPDQCVICHNADFADVLINGVCSRCLRETLRECFNMMVYASAFVDEMPLMKRAEYADILRRVRNMDL